MSTAKETFKLNIAKLENPEKLVDPKSAEFKEELARKAGRLLSEMMDDMLGSSDVKTKASVINAYTKYWAAQQNDLSTIIDKISMMDNRKLGTLEAILKQNKMMDTIREGKQLELGNVFSIPNRQ